MSDANGAPVILAIETSQRVAGVAVRDRSGRIEVEPLRPKSRHDDDLMPAIDRLTGRANLRPEDLDAVAVSCGPGGFTGLRIAVSTAKMLGEALGASIVAVPSAVVAATSALGAREREAIVALAAKRGTVWITRLRGAAEEWRIVGEPGVREAASIDLAEVDVVVGDRFLPEEVRRRCDEASLDLVEPRFDPAACLAIGARMLRRGETTDPLHLQPIYAREPEAVALWKARSTDPADG